MGLWPRRRRAKAANPHAPHVPSGLTFRRRRRPRAGAGAGQLSAPSGGPSRRLSFRRSPRRRAPTPKPAIPSGLSFRRRGGGRAGIFARAIAALRARFRAPAAPAERSARRLTLRRGGKGEQADAPKRRTQADPVGLTLRLVALGFVAGMLQLLVVSQISMLGVSADLAPLVVAAAGFLCGSLPGAVFGFSVGLFVDLAFVQVLGISSLLFIAIGYGAGRLRELRAPAAPFTRLALGALATALALTGYGAIEFMLGVNTPVSYGLAGAILKTTLLNSLIAIPVYAATRRALIGALPESERNSDRPSPSPSGLSPLSRT
jgi:cell shape-determining protein MreD